MSTWATTWPCESPNPGAVFSGPFVLDEDRAIEPTGQTILIGAALVADFDGDKIAALRNYFDDSTLMEQMLLT